MHETSTFIKFGTNSSISAPRFFGTNRYCLHSSRSTWLIDHCFGHFLSTKTGSSRFTRIATHEKRSFAFQAWNCDFILLERLLMASHCFDISTVVWALLRGSSPHVRSSFQDAKPSPKIRPCHRILSCLFKVPWKGYGMLFFPTDWTRTDYFAKYHWD